MPVDLSLLAVLCCPASHASLVVDGERLVSTDPATRRAYRIDDLGIPVMLVDESTVLDEAAWREIMTRHGVKLV